MAFGLLVGWVVKLGAKLGVFRDDVSLVRNTGLDVNASSDLLWEIEEALSRTKGSRLSHGDKEVNSRVVVVLGCDVEKVCLATFALFEYVRLSKQ